MSDKSAIEWTEATWNPVTGCSKVSEGCRNCYAEKLSLRYGWSKKPWAERFAAENVVLHPERLEAPLKWRKPSMIFVNSMSDLFHEQVPDGFIDRVFAVMALAQRHTFQVLTKRPERMRRYFSTGVLDARWVTVEGEAQNILERRGMDPRLVVGYSVKLPLPNVWMGVSAENQRRADERIPVLLDTPAAVRWVSVEPLLGPIDLSAHLPGYTITWRLNEAPKAAPRQGLDWVVVGGESAGPARRRLVTGPHDIVGHPRYLPSVQGHDWVASLRDQCAAAGVPFLLKQWGGPTPKSGGRMLDGRLHHAFPEVRS